MINNENENEDDYEEYSDNDIKLLYEKLTKFILFIETFQKYIIIIVDFINFMDSIFIDFTEMFILKILDNTFMKVNKKISIGNDIIFNLYESLVYCILNYKYNFNVISNELFNELLKKLKLFLTL
ncbi:hypothetical protein BCR36DRAFT_373825 [Piromyces finnis]|uniref:Uncharacterized protein n=1 Tax=Piromyces finnis TaxID=1754191 RepID=A0A1Y1UYV8_9FUNG|nr:hypothetical protein BCR36DRAFT_373825 [Piromyces finnis]|eukprot:ORX43677.1 hypothetical protein BCR36DRAFT_373825 [Piromyces finnis]